MSAASPAVAVDAMGGDQAPDALVAGSLGALRADPDLQVILVGRSEQITPLVGRGLPERLTLEESEGAIPMNAHPAQAVRSQPHASVSVAIRLVGEGRADACFSAGHSGATMAAALLRLHRLPGVARPAIGTVLPSRSGSTLLVDAGAQVDCRPEWLAQFAQLGSEYCRRALRVERPRVGLLSNGEEPSKGNALVQAAHELISQLDLRYLGPVEGTDLLSGKVDVVVSDGFVGNVALKTAEGVADAIMAALRQEANSTPRSRLGALFLLPSLRRLRDRLDWGQVGGAPLLGVGGLVFIGHGRSDARAVTSAIRVAAAAVRAGLTEVWQSALEHPAPAAVPGS
ncbi:MAG TPA: phosphate acyltransferase PlsX [Candidatus Dormibacteraeota bacterium]|nr:phosphate acyltransferase PlsX [Candidatus Dormibacteraeota bacterium]